MKRFAVIFTVILLMVFSNTVTAGAAEKFKISETNPKDGYEKVQATNVMVKLFFNEDVSRDVDKNMFIFKDSEGKKVSFEIIHDPKDATNINLLTTKDLKVNSKYEVVVSKDIASAKGEKLGKDATIEFSTSGGGGGLTYVLLMVAMVAVMGFMTIRDQRKRLKEESEGNEALKIETNPYKLAKERNISVAEANSLINTEREKLRKKQEKQEAKVTAEEKKTPEKPQKKVYKVKTKRVTHIRK